MKVFLDQGGPEWPEYVAGDQAWLGALLCLASAGLTIFCCWAFYAWVLR